MNPIKSLPLSIISRLIEYGLRAFNSPLKVLRRAYWLGSANRGAATRLPLSTQFDGVIRINGSGQISMGEYCRLGLNSYFETAGIGKITLGDRVRINTGSHLVSHKQLMIGDDVLVGEYVSIRDADHGTAPDQLMNRQAHHTGVIKIGNNVWIGRGVCILRGVTIGDGAIIAANSVVTRDVGAMEIHAGTPARLLRSRANY